MIRAIACAALLALPAAASAADAPAEGSPSVEQVYAKHCKNCHGADGKADTKMGKKHKMDSFADPEWQARHSDEKIRDAIANGKPDTKMKAYKGKLSAEQIDALVRYIRGFGPSGAAAR